MNDERKTEPATILWCYICGCLTLTERHRVTVEPDNSRWVHASRDDCVNALISRVDELERAREQADDGRFELRTLRALAQRPDASWSEAAAGIGARIVGLEQRLARAEELLRGDLTEAHADALDADHPKAWRDLAAMRGAEVARLRARLVVEPDDVLEVTPARLEAWLAANGWERIDDGSIERPVWRGKWPKGPPSVIEVPSLPVEITEVVRRLAQLHGIPELHIVDQMLGRDHSHLTGGIEHERRELENLRALVKRLWPRVQVDQDDVSEAGITPSQALAWAARNGWTHHNPAGRDLAWATHTKGGAAAGRGVSIPLLANADGYHRCMAGAIREFAIAEGIPSLDVLEAMRLESKQ